MQRLFSWTVAIVSLVGTLLTCTVTLISTFVLWVFSIGMIALFVGVPLIILMLLLMLV